MASANFTDLKANVALWLQRDDLTAVLPDCVILAEKKINRYLRTLEMEATSTTTPLTATTALPTDCLELRTITISYSGTSYVPRFAAPSKMDELRSAVPTTTGIPEWFCIRGGNIEVYPSPQAGTTFTMTLVYYLRVVPLATTATNWLLTNHWDVYFYGTLLEASAFSRDDPRIPLWKAGYDEAIAGVCRQDDKKKWLKGSMAVDLGLPGISGSIESGFN